MEKKKIMIGLGTFERPKMLQSCLDALSLILLPAETEVILLVADNSFEKSSQSLFESFKEKIPFHSTYMLVKERGIVKMRNAILEKALTFDTDYLVFVDDDELVSKTWLTDLYSFLLKHKADVVSGMVKRKLPEATPKWLIEGGFFNILSYSSAKVLNETSTSNVIFDFKKLVVASGLRFDERLNFFGTSDSLFFRQAYRKGAKILWSNEGVVEEIFPSSRANKGWLLQRKFRKGVTQIKRETILHGSLISYLNGFASLVYQMLNYALQKVKLLKTKGEELKVESLKADLTLYYIKGLIDGMFSKNPFEEYKQKHGY